MKKIILFLLAVAPLLGLAQDPFPLLSSDTPNVYRIRAMADSFYSNIDSTDTLKMKQAKQYNRWKNFWLNRIDSTGYIDSSARKARYSFLSNKG